MCLLQLLAMLAASMAIDKGTLSSLERAVLFSPWTQF